MWNSAADSSIGTESCVLNEFLISTGPTGKHMSS